MKVSSCALGALGTLIVVVLVAFALNRSGCGMIMTDAATRLAFQIEDEVDAMKKSGATQRTFEHLPRRWPEGIQGDYRIELTASSGGHRSGLAVAESYDGPLHYSTTAHSNWVDVPESLVAAHRKGEPTQVTIELRGGKYVITALR